MSSHKLVLPVLLALVTTGAVTAAPPASAHVDVSINIGVPLVAPPPLRFEAVPAPRVGFVWAPGYWNWSGGRYIWIGGVWHPARPGYVYYGPRWVNEHGRWVQHRSYWGNDPHWRHDNGRHRGWYKDRGDHGDHGDHGQHGHGRGHDD